jgi:hypothetical protein
VLHTHTPTGVIAQIQPTRNVRLLPGSKADEALSASAMARTAAQIFLPQGGWD